MKSSLIPSSQARPRASTSMTSSSQGPQIPLRLALGGCTYPSGSSPRASVSLLCSPGMLSPSQRHEGTLLAPGAWGQPRCGNFCSVLLLLPRAVPAHGTDVSEGRRPDPAPPALPAKGEALRPHRPLEPCRAGGWEAGSRGPLPTDPAWKKQRQAALPRNSRAGCQEPRAAAEPGNSQPGDNSPPTPSVTRRLQRLRYGGAPRLPSRAQPPPGTPVLGGDGSRTLPARRHAGPGGGREGIPAARISAAQHLFPHRFWAQTPPFPAFAGKETARGDSFQLDGARLVPQRSNSSFASCGGKILPKSEGRSSRRAERRSSPSPRTAASCAASELFLHHFRPPNRTFLARWGSWAPMDAAEKWLRCSPTRSDHPCTPRSLPGPTGLGAGPPIPPRWGTPRACASRPGSVPSPHMASP